MTVFNINDKTVHRIGYGAMQLAGPNGFGPPDDPEAAKELLRYAVAHGVDHIDTAQVYGPDVVNDLIHEALHPYPEGLLLATKVGGARDAQGAWLPAGNPPTSGTRSSPTCVRCGSSGWTW
ncbi:hypothetical protein GCM10029992_35520 [Glycomyces albus]